MDKFIVSVPMQGMKTHSTKKRLYSTTSTTTSTMTSTSSSHTEGIHVVKNNIEITKTKKRSVQMFLDFGQKSFGSSQSCKLCGMLYVVGDEDDEKRHSVHCKKARTKHCLSSLTTHKILTTYPNEEVIIRYNVDGKHHEILECVLNEVRMDLGTSTDFFNIGDSKILVYLYLSGENHAIVGLLLVEEIESFRLTKLLKETDITTIFSTPLSTQLQANIQELDQKLHNHNHDNDNDHSIDRLTNDLYHSTHGKKSVLGIRLIWTRPEYRKQSIASKLVDNARRFFYYSQIVSPSEIAFSQPTSYGLQFALAYCKAKDIWGYS